MHIAKAFSVVAFLCLLLSACGGMRSFRDMDVNQDGRIDRDEAKQSSRVHDLFESGDDDDSGDLEPEEYESIVYVIERELGKLQRRSGGSGNVEPRR